MNLNQAVFYFEVIFPVSPYVETGSGDDRKYRYNNNNDTLWNSTEIKIVIQYERVYQISEVLR